MRGFVTVAATEKYHTPPLYKLRQCTELLLDMDCTVAWTRA